MANANLQNTDTTVAMIIADQLSHARRPGMGASKLIAMLAAKLSCQDDRLALRFKGSSKVNHCEIILDPSDTYTVNFYHVLGESVVVVKELEGIYADNLREIFERTTGLYTSL